LIAIDNSRLHKDYCEKEGRGDKKLSPC